MRASMTRFCVFALLLLAGLGLGGGAWAEYLVMEAGLQFPDRLGSTTQSRGHRYPQPGLGHGIDYSGSSFGASIYVYDGGAPDITDGISSPVVQAQFAKARSDIFAIQKQNGQAEPQLIGERTVKVGAIEFLSATYRYTRNNLDTLSVVALTGFRRHFIKLRMSMPASTGAAGTAQADEFIRSVARLLADSGPR